MRLLIAGATWPPETFLLRRWQDLARRGVDVTVVASGPPGRGVEVRPEGIRVARLPRWDHGAAFTLVRAAWDGAALAAIEPGKCAAVARAARRQSIRLPALVALARQEPDIVHFEWNSAAIDYWPLVAIWRRPVVISCRGSQILVRPHAPGREEFARALRRTLDEASAVHCVADAVRAEAVQYGLDPAKARVIHTAVDAGFFRPARERPRDGMFRVASVGALRWVKGHEYALGAVRRLVDRGVRVRFAIAGDGVKSERQRLHYAIGDLGLEGVAALRGALDPAAVRTFLQESDAFLLASVSEGISNAALEAMACCLPVVTTACGGMPEAVTDGVEGFVTPVRDTEAMAEALARLAGDQALRKRMGQAGRARVEKDFTPERQAEEFLALYGALTS